MCSNNVLQNLKCQGWPSYSKWNIPCTVMSSDKFICTAQPYGALHRQKLVTFRTPSLIFVRHQSIFRVTQNFFNQFNIYFYATGATFCKHVFLFCAILNNIFFVTHIILLRNVNFYVKYFLFDTTVFCATQDFFVVPNVSKKNIVNKEKKMCSHYENLKAPCCSPHSARLSCFREIKHG